MKIEAPSENKIIVDLSIQDMLELDITYEDMDYSNIETRRVIWTLLDKAGQELGRDIDPTGRMMIEAIPKKAGGCTMHFTILHEEKPSPQVLHRSTLKKDETVLTYEFHNANDLLGCAESFLKMQLPQVASALYEKEGCYRLLLNVRHSVRQIKAYFNEYASLCAEGEFAAAATREHWVAISPHDALEKIGAR